MENSVRGLLTAHMSSCALHKLTRDTVQVYKEILGLEMSEQ